MLVEIPETTTHGNENGDPTSRIWTLSPYALLRLAGKPFDEFERLQLRRTIPLIDALHSVEVQIHQLSDQLCDALYERIGVEQDREICKQFVALKRDIFNKRTLSGEKVAYLTTHLPEQTDNLTSYIDHLAKQTELTLLVEETFAQELVEHRAYLQESLKSEDFGRALLVAQPLLHGKLDRTYLDADPKAIRKKERKIEGQLFSYFARMSTKTSPFSRLGPIIPVEVNADKTDWSADSMRMASEIHFSQTTAFFMANALSKQPAIHAYLYPQVNPSVYIDEEGFIYFWRESELNFDGIIRRSERQIRAKSQSLYEKLLAILKSKQDEGLTYQAYVQHVIESLELNDEQAEKVRQHIQKLVEGGLIILQFKLVSNRFDRLAEIQTQLNAIPNAEAFAGAFAQLEAYVAQYRTADYASLPGIQFEIDKIVKSVMGTDQSQPVNSYIFEDAWLPDAKLALGTEFTAHLEADLSLYLESLLIRDGQHGGGYHVVRDVFEQRYGIGGHAKDLLSFAHYYEQASRHPSIYGPASKRTSSWFQRLNDYMLRLSEQGNDEYAYDVSEILREYIHDNDDRQTPPQSLAVIGQVIADSISAIESGDFQFVIHSVLPGYGHFFSRYVNVFSSDNRDALTEKIRHTFSSYQDQLPPDDEVVEILSVLHNNAQIHPTFTTRQIVLPYEQSDLSPSNQITVDRLSLRHNPETDELELLLDGEKRIHPMYMGFFHTMALPGLHRLLTDLSPTGHHFDHIKPASYRRVNYAEDVVFIPRLHVGKVIFQRACWSVNGAHFSTLFDQNDMLQTMKNVHQWTQQHCLPQQVFMRVTITNAQNSQEAMEHIFNYHKPSIVDFQNVFTTQQILKLFDDFPNGQGIRFEFEEMLPNPDQLFIRHGEQRYVSELQVQFNRGGIDQ